MSLVLWRRFAQAARSWRKQFSQQQVLLASKSAQVESVNEAVKDMPTKSHEDALCYGDKILITDIKGRSRIIKLFPKHLFYCPRSKHQVAHETMMDAGIGSVIKFTDERRETLSISRPTLEQYTVHMKRGAMITYPKDAAIITQLMLDLEAGNKVLEAGTGSGSLTLFLARAVGDNGEVWTFEKRKDFAALSESNVMKSGFSGLKSVKFFKKDLREEALPEGYFDGVVLDMLDPTKSLECVFPALKIDRPIVCYLPNITQVVELVKYVDEHTALNLKLERVWENTLTSWDVRGNFFTASQMNQESTQVKYIARPGFHQIAHSAFLVQFRKVKQKLDNRKHIKADSEDTEDIEEEEEQV